MLGQLPGRSRRQVQPRRRRNRVAGDQTAAPRTSPGAIRGRLGVIRIIASEQQNQEKALNLSHRRTSNLIVVAMIGEKSARPIRTNEPGG
jgi:hypothetical protein